MWRFVVKVLHLGRCVTHRSCALGFTLLFCATSLPVTMAAANATYAASPRAQTAPEPQPGLHLMSHVARIPPGVSRLATHRFATVPCCPIPKHCQDLGLLPLPVPFPGPPTPTFRGPALRPLPSAPSLGWFTPSSALVPIPLSRPAPPPPRPAPIHPMVVEIPSVASRRIVMGRGCRTWGLSARRTVVCSSDIFAC